MDYKTVFSIISVVVGIIGLIPYVRNAFQGKTKPHAFSWSVWGMLGTIALFAQLSKGAGAGVFATGLTAIGFFFIAGIAISQKNKEIAIFDWIALLGAILGILLWILTKNPLFAVICVTVADTLGFFPTFRKGYFKPYEETAIQFALSSLKWILSIPAISSYNTTTLLFPLVLIFTNGAFTVMLLIRRRLVVEKSF